jgi:plasmid replication initiation protein
VFGFHPNVYPMIETFRNKEEERMKKIIAKCFRWLARIFDGELQESYKNNLPLAVEQKSQPEIESTEVDKPSKTTSRKNKKDSRNASVSRKKIKEGEIITIDPRDIRDVMALMEVPFVALSKKRTEPIIYESPDGRSKVKISCHEPHYVASIYDWDIILFVSSKLQDVINSKSDIPPRTLIIPRHDLLKEIHRHDGKKQEKDIKASLTRLTSTFIETTICNEDGRYESGFSFLDSWGYTNRKDVKEFRITLSEWLYEITCHEGALLKIHPEYFKITSGFKRFLYRTARKHVGTQNESWMFSIERLYEKSGSEQEFKKFKYKLKKAVKDNDIPRYMLEWKEEDGQTSVLFINGRKKLKEMLTQKTLPDSAPLHDTN